MNESSTSDTPAIDHEPPTPGSTRRRFLTRVGGSLVAAAVAPFVIASPAAAFGRCQYYWCEVVGIYQSPSCVLYWWIECYDLDTGILCKTLYEPI